MFDLEKAISEWKRAMRRSPSIEESDLAELERYLRDKVEDLGREGRSEEEAFQKAEAEFQHTEALDAAYGQARAARPGRRFPWKPARFDFALLRSNIRIALRRMIRQKAFSLINIGGLALGIACSLLIFLWVRDERSYDRFHANADRIFRVVFSTSDEGDPVPTNANGAYGVGPALKKDFPEVLESVRIRKMEQNPKRYVGYGDKKFYEPRFFFTEGSIFSVFDFPLVRGDAATALAEPGTIVLTEEMAAKYFGTEDPLEKVIEADPYNDGNLMLFRVTGVARNVPRQSHFHFDFLASYAGLREDTGSFDGFYQHFTYVLLNEPASAAALSPRLLEFLKRNWKAEPWYTISFQPLADIHLRSGLRSEIEPVGAALYLYVFSAIALAVLLIACINFMNLATARSAQRAKEIGVRKAIGAAKGSLVRQFLGEALGTSFIATAAAVLMVLAALPLFNRLSGKTLTAATLATPAFILTAALAALLVGLLSGLYPSFFLSSQQPSRALRAKSTSSGSGIMLRRLLVVFQFTLSIGIICSTLVIRGQFRFIQSRDIGYDRDQILIMTLNRDIRRSYDGFKNELLRNPAVENAATSSYVPTSGSAHYNFNFEGGARNLTQVIYFVDHEFFSTYGIKVRAGRIFDRPASGEYSREALISESSAAEAGYASPGEAVGKGIGVGGFQGTVSGVVEDINIYSLHQTLYPIVYMLLPIERHDYLSVRIGAGNIPEALSHLQKTWARFAPSYPLDYSFLDSRFEQLHLSDKRMKDLFSVFSFLAMAIACLGLFGLAAHTVEQRTKEIGIRRVLGASAGNLCLSLSKKFLTWVILANIVAWPAAFLAMQS
ncbi:MAG: ABC transporter permease, partial [Candidatus Aminicenantes bacterium]|nr:ABC transporter permease [Candidatus Aminicenantes bacterium]